MIAVACLDVFVDLSGLCSVRDYAIGAALASAFGCGLMMVDGRGSGYATRYQYQVPYLYGQCDDRAIAGFHVPVPVGQPTGYSTSTGRTCCMSEAFPSTAGLLQEIPVEIARAVVSINLARKLNIESNGSSLKRMRGWMEFGIWIWEPTPDDG
jgi:hypothetical protein